jgi:hypothetical protein
MPGIATSLAALALTAAAATADTILWKTVGGWDISFYPNSAGCQAFAEFEEGTLFFIGFDNANASGALALDITMMDRRWTSLEGGKEYSITINFGDETPWTLNMDGVVVQDMPGLNIMIDASSDEAGLFIDEFQRETRMAWAYGNASLGRYTLRGSRRAFDEVFACQRSYLEALASQSDPFTGTSTRKDPFAD